MKKLFPYILIVFIAVQMLMPFTIGSGTNNNLEVRSNKAEAMFGNNNEISLNETPSYTSKTITINFSVAFSQKPALATKEGVRITKIDPASGVAEVRTLVVSDLTAGVQDTNGFYVYTNTKPILFENLTPNTPYPITIEARQINTLTWTTNNFTTDYWLNTDPIDGVLSILPTINEKVTTNPESITTTQTQATKTAQTTNTSPLPSCGVAGIGGTIPGCVAQIFYYVLFIPTSYVFALAGTFFDFTFHYSIQSSSYNTPFVVQGWGIVRDFCNMFFIFVLLYIAFGTILNLRSVNPKEMIIKVVIIGLLINFSLFATQVIIDASNILAGVFYNSNSIRITQTDNAANGVQDTSLRPKLKIGPNGEIPLSEAIVNKVNPQNLIINASKSVAIQDKYTGENTATDQTGSLGAGAFIIITLLAVAVNVVGIITFLSVGLIFVTRVIGLWLAMILSPFAFFSYTVPALQDMEMIGWKKWWPETIKLAFLAPLFIFFMYLIIAFLDKGLSLVSSNQGTTGMTFVISIIIPFVFIMLLLIQAKNIAKSMSGKLGQSITNGIAAVGGMALGGAAIGTAMLGRRVIGQTVAKASRGDTSTQKYEAAIGNPAAMAKLSNWQKLKGSVGSTVGMGKIYGTNKGNVDPVTGKPIGVEGGIGGILNKKQRKVGDIDYARHEEDEIKKAAGQVDANGQVLDNSKITGEGEKVMENKYNQTKRSDAEAAARKGTDAKGNAVLLNEGTPDEVRGEEAFKSANRNEIADRVRKESADNTDADGKLTPTALKKVENDLNIKLNAAVKITADNKLKKDFGNMRGNAAKHVNPVTRAFAGANKSSYDVRNLSEAKSDKREGMFSKIPVALIGAVAMGVRGGIKNVGMSGGGIKVEGNFMKDLGNTISDSLKSMKVNVNLEHVGETKSSADAHGGGSEAHH